MNDSLNFITWLLVAMTRASVIVAMLPLKSTAGRAFLLPFPLAIGLCIKEAGIVSGPPSFLLFLIAVKEALLGAALGFMISRLFIVVSAAGAVLDQQAGYTVGAVFNPNLGRSTGPIESLYTLLLILLLMTAGSGFFLANSIIATYAAWPIASLIPSGVSLSHFLENLLSQGIDAMIDGIVQMALPILAMIMFSDICVALLGRYAQELNPMSTSLALKAVLVALMLAVTLPRQLGNLQRLIAWLLKVQ